MKRRTFLQSVIAAAGVGFPNYSSAATKFGAASAFSLDAIVEMARSAASEPYVSVPKVPQDWLDLDYDQYKSIRFNPNHALWAENPSRFRVEFFSPGLYFDRPVQINVVENNQSREVQYDPEMFVTSDLTPELTLDERVNFSGFRVRGPVGSNDNQQEMLVMQGGTYFRSIGEQQIYGLSARGLAIDTAEQSGEEFPDFTEFWIEKPDTDAAEITVHAYLDSPGATGVYSFVTIPGTETRTEVKARIFARRDLPHIGLAPMSSMFFFDETNRNRFDDFRPAVHDSDGLLIHNGAGESLWRPIANPLHLQVSSFVDENPAGFGLMQRANNFSDLADLEAEYHRRPSLWIEPGEDWGQGAVTLVEIPTNREIYDNIVAYWRPREPLAAGQEHAFSYRLTWGGDPPSRRPLAHVLNTRMGARFEGGIVAAIDFSDEGVLPENLGDLTLHVSTNRGKVSEGILQRNPETDGVRLAFTFYPEESRQMELRAQLVHNSLPVSEVWLYRWTA